MEAWSILNHRLSVFCHLLIQQISRIPLLIADSIKIAGTYATAAALAGIMVNNCLVIHIGNSIRTTLLGTFLTATAFVRIYYHLAGGMLFHLASTTATTHANILNSTTKASSLMALEMSQADKYICIHYRPANFGCLANLTILYRYLHIISTLQAIANNNLATSRNAVKSVNISTFNMLQGILTAAWIQGITICQEWQTTLLLHQICNSLGIIRTQKG